MAELVLKFGGDVSPAKRASAELRLAVAQDLAGIRDASARTLAQMRTQTAQGFASIRQSAAQSLGQTRVDVAQQLAQIRVNTAQQLTQIRQSAQQSVSSIGQSVGQLGGQVRSLGTTLTVGLTAPILALGAASTKSAKDIDATVNTLRAFTGSAEAAERRLAQLIATAQRTPGLTTSLASKLDAQLRTVSVTEQTIDRILPAVGRLNAVSSLADPARFAQNLTQLVTQNFERQDLKELVGQSPVAGQILKELFNVDSPTNAKAIREAAKRMGITTTDAFFAAFAEAAQNSPVLSGVTESLGTRLEKSFDRLTVALRPLGQSILETIIPALNALVPVVESVSRWFASLSEPMRLAIITVAALVAAIGPLLIILGGVVGAVGSAIAAVGGIKVVLIAAGGAVTAFVAILGPLLVVLAALTAAAAVLYAAWQTNFGGIRELVGSTLADVSSLVTRYTRQIGELVTAGMRVVRGAMEVVTAAMRGDWSRVWGIITTKVASAAADIVVILTNMQGRFMAVLALIVARLFGWGQQLTIAALRAVGAMFDSFVNYTQTVGLYRAVNAVLGVAAALMNPAVLAMYAYAGYRQAKARADAYEAEQARLDAAEGGSAGVKAGAGLRTAPSAPSFGGAERAGGKGRKGKSEAEKRAEKQEREAREALEREGREMERAIRYVTDQNERAYQERLIGFEEYAKRQTVAENKRYNEQVGLLARQKAHAEANIKDEFERRRELAQIEEKRLELEDAHARREQEIADEKNNRRKEAEEAHLKAVEELRQHYEDLAVKSIEERIKNESLKESVGAEQIQAIRDAAFERQRAALNKEAAAYKGVPEVLAEYTERIKRLDAERVASAEAAAERIRAARERESPPPLPISGQTGVRPSGAAGPRVDDAFNKALNPPDVSPWQSFSGAIIRALGEAQSFAVGFGDSVSTAFGSVVGAMGQAVAASLVYGQSFGDAIKQAVAGAMQALAAEAFVQSILNLAKGFAALAGFMPGPAALYFKASAAFAAAGLAAGGVGFALAGGGSAGGPGAYSAAQDQSRATGRDRTIREERRGGTTGDPTRPRESETLQPIVLTLDGEVLDRKMARIITSNGDTRTAIKRMK